MARPVVLVAPHRRELDTALGNLTASIVYDAFPEHITRAGAEALILWPGTSDIDALIDRADGVVLIGGGDVKPGRFGSSERAEGVDDLRDVFELKLVKECRARSVPLLAMCRGAQVLNVAAGGTLKKVEGHRQQTELSEPAHSVFFDSTSTPASLFGRDELKVNSFHQWAVDRIGSGMAVAARAEDGVIEAFEALDDWWALGIQWHAELLDDPSSQRLFGAFVATIRGED
jgi:putative glutamine amidotransferase